MWHRRVVNCRLSNYMAKMSIVIHITVILGNAVTSQHGALLSDDIKALKTNR